jgi:hypothetical protein
MRKQIQQLQEHFKQYENRDNDDENDTEIGSSSNNEDDVNAFHHIPNH